MSDYGVVLEGGTVRFERLLDAPVERVWAYLTEGDKLGRWFAGGTVEPRQGGKITLTFHHDRLSDSPEPVPEKYKSAQGYSFTGEIVEWQPQRLITWSWPDDKQPSTVTFELFPEGKKTRLVLSHRKLPSRKEWTDVMGGWHSHLRVLADAVAGRPRGLFWPAHDEAEKAYAKRVAPDGAAYVTRRIAAPVEKVFHAWTDAKVAKAWSGVTLTNEPRKGGRYHSETKPGDAAENCIVDGVYKEFEPNGRVAQSWIYRGPGAPQPVESFVTLDFMPDGKDATLVTVTETGDGAEESKEAWRHVLEALAKHVE